MSTENINIVSICSIVMGNNIPLALGTQTKQAEKQRAVSMQGKQPVVEEKSSAKVKAADGGKAARPCVYRGLLRRVLIVGILALVLGLWCRKQRGEPEELTEA